ncbi:AAA family ATPase [Streptomyces sp. JB150]|uniref:caspase, EACC1-associated type n=1 Tax=Streptomyces sp. JB150 TaxID=2714844 RepID=UPI00140906F0|nr:AAA family ATPase [Streptomyces sp. JB150]QIJ63829.1 AAA family ATPase [Streptomyces sp. JB150]
MVVGTGTHPGDRLHDLPAAVPSAQALAETLRTHCGMGDRVRLLTDPASPSDVLEALAEAVDRAAPTEERPESGIVVFCFVGHGLRGPGGRLYLATAATKSLTDTAHSVPYAEIERYLGDTAAADPVLVLDCCFAGNAREPGRTPGPDPFGASRPQGSYLLGSAQRNTLAYAPKGAEYTLFTGHLLRLLREGDAGAARLLTLGGVYRLLDQRLQGEAARPYGGGTARMAELVLTENRRYRAQPAADGPAAPDDDADAVCPYPGLRPFLPEQHHLFFGREEMTERLLARVAATRPGEPLVLLGNSGVGKSSLLRAGLSVTAQRAGLGPVCLVPAPGARPFRRLAEAWAQAVGRPLADVVRDLERGRFTPARTERQGQTGPQGQAGGQGRPVPGILVVDQLEQYFTHGADEDERARFAAALTAAGGPRVVLALRADYHGDVLGDPHLAPFAERGHFVVPALNDAEIEAAIVEPARYAGLQWEAGVPRILLREVNEERRGGRTGDAAALPYLAYVLQEIWLRRRGRTLTYAAYQEAGGIRDAVARAADRIHDHLDEDGRRRLRALMLAMVQVADGEGRLVRRRVPREELADARDLLRLLADAHLVVVDEDGGAQLGHDSLLHAWQRLTGWIEEARGDLLRLRRLTAAAEGWDEGGRGPSGLWRGFDLREARELAAGRTAGAAPVRQVVRDFVAASEAAERRRRRAVRAWVSVLSVLTLLAASLAGWAFYENGQAASRERALIAKEIANRADRIRDRDPGTALRLSLAAYNTAETAETRSGLYASAITLTPVHLTPAKPHREPVLNLAYRPDGKALAASHRDGRVRLWDLSDPGRPVEAGHFRLNGRPALAHHPARPLLAAQTGTELTLWNTADPHRPRRLVRLPVERSRTAFSVAFSGDGRTLASGGDKGRLWLWDVSDPARPALRAQRTVAEAGLISLAFTRNGHHLITGNGNGPGANGHPAQVRLWDLTDPGRPDLLDTERADSVMSVAVHPRRDLVVANGGGGVTAWWRVVDGRELRRVHAEDYLDRWGASMGMPQLDFSPDGRFLAGADRGEGVRRLTATATAADLAKAKPELPVLSAGQPVQSVAYSPDSRYLAAGEVGGEIRLWTEHAWAPALPGYLPVQELEGTSPISADGRLLITKEEEPDHSWTTRIWSVGDHGSPKPRYTLPKGWEANWFLTGRRGDPVLLAHHWTGGLDHALQLWRFGAEGPPRRSPSIRYTADVSHIAVSPDNRLLAVGSREEPTIALWDISDPAKPVRRADIPAQAKGGLFASGHLWFAGPHTVVTVENRWHLRFWDVSDPDHPRMGDMIEDGALGEGAMYDDTSKLLITEESGHTIRLYDLSRPARPVEGGRIPAAPESYFPAGKDELATAVADGTIEFWDVSDPGNPRKKRKTVHLDRAITSLAVTADRRHAITGSPYRLWSLGRDGRWSTPEFATLEAAQSVRLPSGRGWLAVTTKIDAPGLSDDENTYILDYDTDRLYEAMCRTLSVSLSQDRWEALFPHLEHRDSCG